MNDVALAGPFAGLSVEPPDALLAIIGRHRADPRADKIDVGVGVYRDETGRTPVLRAVKAAEARLLERQDTKAYLGPEGDIGYFERLLPIVLGDSAGDRRPFGLQTPGGTGALRLAFDLVARARPDARVHLGAPTWPNHEPIVRAAGLTAVAHTHFDVATQRLMFGDVRAALERASAGDVVLLHGSCHNPTGADFDGDQWTTLADIMARRGLLPLIDIAYQGLGSGLDEDVAGLRAVVARCDTVLIAYSCDKNFGLYRERVGMLVGLCADPAAVTAAQSHLLSLARAAWSMPPDHGAAIVRTILEDAELTADWRAELEEMRLRIVAMRTGLAARDPMLAPLARQQGMFTTLPLSRAQVDRLRDEHAIYMTGSGRINIAGLTPATLSPFVEALAAVR